MILLSQMMVPAANDVRIGRNYGIFQLNHNLIEKLF